MYQSLHAGNKPASSPDATILFIFNDGQLRSGDKSLDKQEDGLLTEAIGRADCQGKRGEVTVVYGLESDRYVLLGLGSADDLTAAGVRAAAGSLVKALHRLGVSTATARTHAGVMKPVGSAMFGRAIGEGVGLAAFDFNDFKNTTKADVGTKKLTLTLTSTPAHRELATGLKLAESANFARRLAATPPNVATTMRIASEAQKLARQSNGRLKCTVIKGKALETNKLTGLINVGKASENPPCLIQLTYTPRGKSTGTVLLVGKTVCYDTGGLSLKISNGMKGMKYDKNGGMAVIGAMHAVSWLKPKCKVIALLPVAENSVSDEAYRPDDIITFLNGVTVEVTNTDAEGRLVLADALAYGCKKIKPDAIIDLATLTGGVVVALGAVCAGLWCEDDKLRGKIDVAAETSGERVWRMPLHDEYKEMMKSRHADIWNSAPVRHAHPIQGAAFLSYFVDEKIPWAHIDIAGTSAIDKEDTPFAAGPTGFGVRLLADLLMKW